MRQTVLYYNQEVRETRPTQTEVDTMKNYEAELELFNDSEYLAWLDERAEEAFLLQAMEDGVSLI